MTAPIPVAAVPVAPERRERVTETARYYELRWSPESYYPGLRVRTREQADAILAALRELVPDLSEVSVHEIVVHDGPTAACVRAFLAELGELTGEFSLADYAPHGDDDLDPWEWADRILRPDGSR